MHDQKIICLPPFCCIFFTRGLVSQADDREAKRDTPEEGELREQRMEITIRNSPYTREDSTEDRFLFNLLNPFLVTLKCIYGTLKFTKNKMLLCIVRFILILSYLMSLMQRRGR